jgi:hypothetical protein
LLCRSVWFRPRLPPFIFLKGTYFA